VTWQRSAAGGPPYAACLVLGVLAASCSLDYGAFDVARGGDASGGDGPTGTGDDGQGAAGGFVGTGAGESTGGFAAGGAAGGDSTGGGATGGANGGGAPSSVCGDGQVQGTEACDGEPICDANCSLMCPGFSLNGLCYWRTSTNQGFSGSADECKSDGGSLAILPTTALIQGTFLAVCPNGTCDHLWVGASQLPTATQAGQGWTWFDGNPVSPSIWAPDNGFVAEDAASGDQDCAQILLEGLADPWLNDWQCGSMRRALCQYPPNQAP